MKQFSIALTFIGLSNGQSACTWEGKKSGKFIECKPGFYMKGACESDTVGQLFFTFTFDMKKQLTNE